MTDSSLSGLDSALAKALDQRDLFVLEFTPVQTSSSRRDGWTADRQRRFLALLALTGVVAAAARAIGMSATSAYNLRRRDDAGSFATAWDIAVEQARHHALAEAYDRAANGVMVPRLYRGQVVGMVRKADHRMAMAALRNPPKASGARWTKPDDSGMREEIMRSLRNFDNFDNFDNVD